MSWERVARFGLGSVKTLRGVSRTAPEIWRKQCRLNSTARHFTRVSSVQSTKSSVWTTGRVLLLATVASLSTYTYATMKTPNSDLDYGRKDKFKSPEYGTMKEMELV